MRKKKAAWTRRLWLLESERMTVGMKELSLFEEDEYMEVVIAIWAPPNFVDPAPSSSSPWISSSAPVWKTLVRRVPPAVSD